jgi:hypothetical protein
LYWDDSIRNGTVSILSVGHKSTQQWVCLQGNPQKQHPLLSWDTGVNAMAITLSKIYTHEYIHADNTT